MNSVTLSLYFWSAGENIYSNLQELESLFIQLLFNCLKELFDYKFDSYQIDSYHCNQ